MITAYTSADDCFQAVRYTGMASTISRCQSNKARRTFSSWMCSWQICSNYIMLYCQYRPKALMKVSSTLLNLYPDVRQFWRQRWSPSVQASVGIYFLLAAAFVSEPKRWRSMALCKTIWNSNRLIIKCKNLYLEHICLLSWKKKNPNTSCT